MWYYNEEQFTETPDNYTGFVYIITDLSNNRKYVGKKLFYRSKILPKNSKRKRRSRETIESDWRTYCGSSKKVSELVEEYGLDRFKREIIRLCKTKGEMTYFEMKEQIDREVLFSDDYYNEFIGGKIHSKHLGSLKRK